VAVEIRNVAVSRRKAYRTAVAFYADPPGVSSHSDRKIRGRWAEGAVVGEDVRHFE
jgi:hypothetical protein